MSFWCLQIDRKTNEILVRTSALASKKRPNQKKLSTSYHQLDDYILTLTLLFWFHLFLEARVEIPTKFLLVFWSIWKDSKGDFEINWPLGWAKQRQLWAGLWHVVVASMIENDGLYCKSGQRNFKLQAI